MRRIGIVAALPGELAPLVRGWRRRGEVFVGGWHPSVQGYAACAGMGAAAATHAFAEVKAAAEQDGAPLDAVVSYGWAGAISCGVKPPQVHSVSQVIESRTGERFPTAGVLQEGAAALRLVTLDHIARPAEKRALAERYKAVLVDMEAATVARLARVHRLSFFCVKGISDGYTDALPDFTPFLDAGGQLRMPAFVGHALLHPASWPALWRLRIQSRAAARHLADALPACLAEARLVS